MTPQSERRRRWLLFVVLAIAIVVADQLSKLIVDANFPIAAANAAPGMTQPTPVIDDVLRVAKSYNSGGIFGLFGNSAPVLALTSTVVIALIAVYQAREGIRSWPLTVALALLLGGAIGNFLDRVRLGAVIDFVDMGIGNTRWYTFNVADAAISIALVVLLAIALLGDRLTRRVEQHAA